VTFNPNSNPQLQKLLYEEMDLPVIDKTDSKQPATGGDTLEKLQHHTTNQDYLDIIEALNGYSKAAKILSSFIPAFERAIDKGDGVVYLHGSFNLGGTKSGRLSSSDPNLQNIPAGSTYGTLIKGCFKAPDGYLFGGADFNSLEDYVSALTTKDPNKLKVYQGHEVFEVTINNSTHHIREDATVVYQGKHYTGKEFYETYSVL
jgi:DNA polymerase-1